VKAVSTTVPAIQHFSRVQGVGGQKKLSLAGWVLVLASGDVGAELGG